jgi:hypothetical protein
LLSLRTMRASHSGARASKYAMISRLFMLSSFP